MKKKNTKTYIGIVLVAILALFLANPQWLPLSRELKAAVADSEKSNLFFKISTNSSRVNRARWNFVSRPIPPLTLWIILDANSFWSAHPSATDSISSIRKDTSSPEK